METQEHHQKNATGVRDVTQLSIREIDDAKLAQMGKRPVLKVCLFICLCARQTELRFVDKIQSDLLIITAKLWLMVDSWVQLYDSDNLGGDRCVSQVEPIVLTSQID